MTNHSKIAKFRYWRLLLSIIPVLGIIFIWIISSRGLWKDQGRTNIIFNTTPILIISLNHDNSSAQILAFPTKAEIDVVEGYGKYRAGKIYYLDLQEKKAGKLFSNTFSKGLGIPIDGYVSFSDKISNKDEKEITKDDIIKNKSKLFRPDFFLHSFWQKNFSASTNLTTLDFIRSFIFMSGVRPNKIDLINLHSQGAFDKIILPDQTESLLTDYQKIDEIIKESVNEQPILSENLKVEVLNSTDYEGLAEEIARIISHTGAAVLNTGNDSEKVVVCKIYTAKNFIKTYSVKRFQDFFNCQLSFEPRVSRTDLTIILGEKIKKDYRTR